MNLRVGFHINSIDTFLKLSFLAALRFVLFSKLSIRNQSHKTPKKKETLKKEKTVLKTKSETDEPKVEKYANSWSTCVSPPNETLLATSYVTQKQDHASQDWLV